jgi:hypothetical protein
LQAGHVGLLATYMQKSSWWNFIISFICSCDMPVAAAESRARALGSWLKLVQGSMCFSIDMWWPSSAMVAAL